MRKLLGGVGLMLGLAVSGCSLYRPFVVPTDDGSSSGQLVECANVEDAGSYAVKKERDFVNAANDYAAAQRTSETLLIPTMALLGYKVAASPNADNLAAIGAGGLTIFGLGSTLATPSTRQLYLAGERSVACAIGVTAPYRIPSAVKAQAAEAGQAIDRIENALAQQMKAGDQAIIVLHDALRKTYLDTNSQLTTKFPNDASAQVNLCSATHTIVAETNLQIGAVLPDLSAITATLKNMPSTPVISQPPAASTGPTQAGVASAKSTVDAAAQSGSQALAEAQAAMARDEQQRQQAQAALARSQEKLNVAQTQVNAAQEKLNTAQALTIQLQSGPKSNEQQAKVDQAKIDQGKAQQEKANADAAVLAATRERDGADQRLEQAKQTVALARAAVDEARDQMNAAAEDQRLKALIEPDSQIIASYSAAVNALSATGVIPADGLQACTDVRVTVNPPLALAKSAPAIQNNAVTVKAGGKLEFDISGGKPQYFVTLAPADTATTAAMVGQITVATSPNGSSVHVTINTQGGPASAKVNIQIQDSAGAKFDTVVMTINATG
jgi:hypothetical protein